MQFFYGVTQNFVVCLFVLSYCQVQLLQMTNPHIWCNLIESQNLTVKHEPVPEDLRKMCMCAIVPPNVWIHICLNAYFPSATTGANYLTGLSRMIKGVNTISGGWIPLQQFQFQDAGIVHAGSCTFPYYDKTNVWCKNVLFLDFLDRYLWQQTVWLVMAETRVQLTLTMTQFHRLSSYLYQ